MQSYFIILSYATVAINLVKTLHSKQPLKQLLKLKFFKNFNINTKQGYAFQMINKYHFEPQ